MAKISGQDTSNIDGVDGFYTTQGGGSTPSTTPTLTVSGGTFGIVTAVINNHASYTNPNYSAEAKVGATVTVLDNEVTRILDASGDHIGDTLSLLDSDATAGQRTLTVKAQEFGDFVQSAGEIGTYTTTNVQNRYIRIRGVDAAGVSSAPYLGITNIRFCDASSGGGTNYPTTNLTSNTSETGIVVSSGHIVNASYDTWKACDGVTNGFWWSLGTTAANNWWQIEFEAATYPTIPIIKSLNMYVRNSTATHFSITGSDTGAFTGEEVDYGVFEIIQYTNKIYG